MQEVPPPLSLSLPLREKTEVFLNADSENFIFRFPFVIIKTLLTVVIMLTATCGTLARRNLTDAHFLHLLPGSVSGKYGIRCVADLKG